MFSLYNKLPNEFIIFDTEFTAWEGSMQRNWNKDYEKKELVQISGLKIKKIDNSLRVIDTINIFIKPKVNPVLSKYFIDLTGITQRLIESYGVHFLIGINYFYKFSKNDNNEFLPMYSYGNDYSVIKENLIIHNFKHNSRFYNWGNHFYDIKTFFKDYVNVHEYTSGNLYKAFNIKPGYGVDIHNSLWDSKSLFLSLKYLVDKEHNSISNGIMWFLPVILLLFLFFVKFWF